MSEAPMEDLATDRLVDDYLARLHAAAGMLAADRRAELVEEIRVHIEEALAAAGGRDEATVRNVLDRLGAPEEIVRLASTDAPTDGTAGPGPGPQAWSGPPKGSAPVVPPRGLGLETAAVILLLVGGVILPILGWFIGLALLASSSLWTVRDKLLGALVWPGGLVGPVFIGTLLPVWEEVCVSDGMVTDQGEWTSPTTCTGGPSMTGTVLGVAGFVALVGLPIVVAIYLLHRARRAREKLIATSAAGSGPGL